MTGPVGATGATGAAAPLPGMEATPAALAKVRFQNSTGNTDVTLDVVTLGWKLPIPLGLGGTPGRPTMEPLVLAVLPKPGVAKVLNLQFRGATNTVVTVLVPDPLGGAALVPLLTSTINSISKVQHVAERNSQQAALVQMEIGLGNFTLLHGTFSTGWSQVTTVATCVDTPCGCAAPFPERTYVATAGMPLSLGVGEQAVDWASAGGATAAVSVGGGMLTAGRAIAGPVVVERPLSADLLCDIRQGVVGTPATRLTLQHADPLSAQFGPRFDQSTVLRCSSPMTEVELYQGTSGIQVRTTYAQNAVEQTFRAFDPGTGNETGSQTSLWNYAQSSNSINCP